MVVWPQTKLLAKFEFRAVVVHSILPSSRTLCARLSRSVVVLSLETLEQSCKFEKYNGQCTGAELAICTVHVEGRQAGPRVLL